MSWNKDVQKMYVPKPNELNNNYGETGESGQSWANYPQKIAGLIAGAVVPEFGFPLPEELRDNVTSPYGMRKHPLTGNEKFHNGVDYGAEIGTSIYAAADGIVKRADYDDTHGHLTIIEHKNGVQTWYAHQSDYNVVRGQEVYRGNIIGRTGNSGTNTTGAHLHFEVRINGRSVKPYFK